MRDHIEAIRALQAELIVIGNGQPEHVRGFVEDLAIDIPVFTDPSTAVFRAIGARRGWGSSLHWKTFVRSTVLVLAGGRQRGVQGDPLQQGGVAIVLTDGSLPYLYRSEFAGDHPEPEAILEALRAAV